MENEQAQTPVSETSQSTQKRILLFGKHQYIIDNAASILAKGGYQTHGFVTVDTAVEHLQANAVDAVFIGGAVDPHDRLAIKGMLDEQFPHVKLIDHFGGPATILSEVQSVLG
jgi:DNA-binding NtrC family response regulator